MKNIKEIAMIALVVSLFAMAFIASEHLIKVKAEKKTVYNKVLEVGHETLCDDVLQYNENRVFINEKQYMVDSITSMMDVDSIYWCNDKNIFIPLSTIGKYIFESPSSITIYYDTER